LSLREVLHGVAVPLSASTVWPAVLFLVTIAGFGCWSGVKNVDPSQMAGLAVALTASISDARYAALFAIAAGFWLATPLNERLTGRAGRTSSHSKSRSKYLSLERLIHE
jgi:hypothetical protein